MDKEPHTRNTYWREYGFAFSATLSLLAGGASLAWASPTLPILMDESQEHPITHEQGSWIVSLLILASAISPLPTALVVDRWGRKLTLLVATIPSIAAWIIILANISPAWLYISRILLGLNFGIIYTVMPMYLGEISSKEVRGSIGILVTVMAKVGTLLAYSIGPYVTIEHHAIAQMLIPIVFFLTFMWSPESPYCLLLLNRENEAERALQRLRGRKDVKEEFHSIADAVKIQEADPRSFRQLFQTKGNRRGLIIIPALFCGSELCGSQAVISYSQEIFTEAKVFDPKLSTIILGIVQLIFAVLSGIIVDKCGRRPLLILSCGGVTLMTALIGVYFYIKDFLKWDTTNLTWLPMLLIFVYIAIYNVGLSAVPFTVIGEIFPTNVKAIAVCLAIMIIGILSFAVTKMYQIVVDELGTYVAFCIFCIFSIISLILITIYVPETKGKTLAQIQTELNQKQVDEDNTRNA